MVDEAFAGIGIAPRVVAEIESASTLTAVIADGLGATILPESMAREVVATCDAGCRGSSSRRSRRRWRCASRTTCRCPSRRRPSRTSCWSWSSELPGNLLGAYATKT